MPQAFAGAGGLRVVLMHAPSGLLDIGVEAFTVAVCGHTHGGQVALPSGRPLVVGHDPSPVSTIPALLSLETARSWSVAGLAAAPCRFAGIPRPLFSLYPRGGSNPVSRGEDMFGRPS